MSVYTGEVIISVFTTVFNNGTAALINKPAMHNEHTGSAYTAPGQLIANFLTIDDTKARVEPRKSLKTCKKTPLMATSFFFFYFGLLDYIVGVSPVSVSYV